MRRVLILGGTTEARRVAELLAVEPGFEATVSLAGRTAAPRPPRGPHRSGGFGGADGLARWLREHRTDAVVDATHPFAATVSGHAAVAAARTGVPLLALRRPGWTPGPGDRWLWADSLREAAALLAGFVPGASPGPPSPGPLPARTAGGFPDAGFPDAGAPDAGAPDAGAPDAGIPCAEAPGPADAAGEPGAATGPRRDPHPPAPGAAPASPAGTATAPRTRPAPSGFPPDPARAPRVFLTTGRGDLAPFAAPALAPFFFLVRSVDAPEPPLPARHHLLLARGPFTVEGERALLREHRVDVLVTKDSGGEATAAKLRAAREAGIPVVVVRRPPPPRGVPLAADPAAALAWLRALSPGPADGE